jgi:ubiquitin-like domain-containing CTD phosphatase 1
LQNYSEKNTIMFDDIRHNYVMNPQNGLVIRPFRKAHFSRASDQELLHLTDYLLAIAELEDLSGLDHEEWEAYVRRQRRRRA